MYAVFFALAVVLVSASAINLNPDTVATLDVPKYLGNWYQMYADQIVVSSFEAGSFCCTAFYGDNGDGTLSVHNYASQNDPSGAVPYTIDGYAYQTNAEKHPGELKVVLNSPDAAPFPAPYWILELGPVNSDGLYDWAIVSDSASLFLFVLARDVSTFYAKYNKDVEAAMKTLGFTGLSAPIRTYQGPDCVYESDLRAAAIKRFTFANATVASSASTTTTCNGIKSEKTCMTSSENGETCSWCTSGAVGASCNKESDAKSLPSSVFECVYQ